MKINKNEFIERGNNIIYKERREDWEKFVNENIRGEKYYFSETIVNQILEVMEALDEGKNKLEINEIIYSKALNHFSYFILLRAVTKFSKKGLEFYKDQEYEYDQREDRKEYIDKHLIKIAEENKKFEKNEFNQKLSIG